MNTHRTLAQRIGIKLTHNLVAVLMLGAVGVAANATTATTYEPRPEVTDSAAALLAANDCWTDEAPAGVVPGHVVVTVDGQPQLGGPHMTGQALAQLFDGADHGLTIHGFCA